MGSGMFVPAHDVLSLGLTSLESLIFRVAFFRRFKFSRKAIANRSLLVFMFVCGSIMSAID